MLFGKSAMESYALTTVAVRMVPALFGLGTIGLVFLLRRWLGTIATLTAALLLALSPGAVYLSRYFIHETLFAFFTLGIVVAGLYFYEQRNPYHLMLASAQSQGIPTVEADAAAPGVLETAGIAQARLIVVATPDSFQARRIVELARRNNHAIDVVVRTHSSEEIRELERLGANRVVMGERELARGMLEFSLRSLGVPAERARAVAGRDAPVNAEGT